MPSLAFNKFQPFAEAVYEKVHNFGSDQFKFALTTVAPSAANAVLADLTEIVYTNFSTRNITTASSSQSGGVYKWMATDLVISASGGAGANARYIVVYNDTAASKNLVGYFDYGVGGFTLGDGESITMDFDGTNGAISHT